jgi:formamidase
MGSTGSVSRPSEGLLLGMVQYPVPKLANRRDIEANIDTICEATANTKAGYPGMDLIVWPAYSTQGLNFRKWVSDDFLLQEEDPAFQKFAQTCKESDIWGVFSLIERNSDPDQMPFKSAVIFNNHGELVLKYRMLNPWVPRGPWTPGDLGVPVCKGPGGSVLALCINNDGMFPEHAREAAYKGCNVYIRISAHSSQVKEQWEVTNRSNAWHNLMYTASINLSGYDGIFYYFGGGEVCNFDGHTIVQSQRNPWEIVTAEIYPRMADQARRDWALDNNILNLGSRGYVAVPGGVKECPYSWIKDFAKGAYKVPWEEEVKVKDGSFYGYPTHGGRFGKHE